MSPSYMELCICPVLGEIITKLQHSDIVLIIIYSLHKNTVNEHHCPLNITYHQCERLGLTLENQIAWKTVSEIIKLKHFAKMYI